MKTRDKILSAIAIGILGVISFTLYKTVQVLKQLGDITLDIPNDPLLSSLFRKKDNEED